MDIRAEHTWDEVLSVQQRLFQDRDDADSKGVKGFWHKKVRKFSDNSESFQSWLKLLPSESQYFSVLCGGLTLVLGVSLIVQRPQPRSLIGVIRPHIECPRSGRVFETSLVKSL